MEIGKRDLILRILNEQLELLQTKNVEKMQELEQRQNANSFLSDIIFIVPCNFFSNVF